MTLRCMICGDGEVELNMDQVLQLALEVCKEDVLALMIHNLPNLGWEVSAAATPFFRLVFCFGCCGRRDYTFFLYVEMQARKDLVHCWSILLKQKVESRYCSGTILNFLFCGKHKHRIPFVML